MSVMKIVIDKNLCCGSGECVKICPDKAISIVDGKAVLDEAKCDFDGICIPACPCSAISFDDGEVGGCGF
ncbi:MAG: ferredoxin [Desulfuromusa sp.]|nr:ferredoxin [Desulfuromusa sp.]